MQNKKMLILIIVGVLAVISIIYGLTASPGDKKRAASDGGHYAAKGPSAAAEKACIDHRAVRTKFTSWKRSPFIHKEGPGDVSHLVLNGIFTSGKDSKASINNTIVGKGGMIGGNTVVAIKKDRVVLNDGVKNFELRLER